MTGGVPDDRSCAGNLEKPRDLKGVLGHDVIIIDKYIYTQVIHTPTRTRTHTHTQIVSVMLSLDMLIKITSLYAAYLREITDIFKWINRRVSDLLLG